MSLELERFVDKIRQATVDGLIHWSLSERGDVESSIFDYKIVINFDSRCIKLYKHNKLYLIENFKMDNKLIFSAPFYEGLKKASEDMIFDITRTINIWIKEKRGE